MSDFKFACPGCGQRILANDDYVGYQINCPACQAAIIVPANPAAPAAPAAPSSIAITTPPGTQAAARPALGRKAVRVRLGIRAAASRRSFASAVAAKLGGGYRRMWRAKTKKSYSGLIDGGGGGRADWAVGLSEQGLADRQMESFPRAVRRRDRRHQPASAAAASAAGTDRLRDYAKGRRGVQGAAEL